MPRKLIHGPERPTNPMVWCVAVVCTVISVAVIVTGLAVFIGYLIIHPSVPVIGVIGAQIVRAQNDQAGIFDAQLVIVMRAQNDNAKAHAGFSDFRFLLSFRGIGIASLQAADFEVPKNASQNLPFHVESLQIPLGPGEVDEVSLALKQDQITFDLKGHVRARWRVGPLGSIKFWCNLDCQLKFHPMTGKYMNSPCTSRAK